MVARRTPEPMNQSKAAGVPAPRSAAATAPRGYYDPESPTPKPTAPTALAAATDGFTAGVRRDHMAGGEHFGSADREVVESAVAEDSHDGEDLDAAIARIRATRKPLGAFSQKLALPKRTGYHRHWFNDVAGRIDEAKANGWAHVKGTDGKILSRCVGTGRDKGSLFAFAMEIPLIFWEEDQAAYHEAAAGKVDALKNNVARAAPGTKAAKEDRGKFYDPQDGEAPVSIVKGQ